MCTLKCVYEISFHHIQNYMSSKRIELETSNCTHIVANLKTVPLLSYYLNHAAKKRRTRLLQFGVLND